MKRYMSPTPGSDAWVELRRSGIGATDAPVVCGRSPFRSPFQKFAELTRATPPHIPTDAMLWGTRLQPVVGAAWAEEHGKKIRACRYIYELEPGIFSSYDYEVVPPKGQPVTELVEVKTTSAYAQREYGEEGTAEIPEGYQIQTTHEMACRPLIKRVHVAVLIGGQKLRSYVVERDDGMIEDLLKIERMFLANSKAGIAPPMDGSEAATAFLRGISPHDDGSKMELTESVEALALAFLSAKEQEKASVGRTAEMGNLLRAAMGDNSAGIGKSVKVSYKNGKDSDWIDWRAVGATARPEIIVACTSTRSGTRPLLVTWIGE